MIARWGGEVIAESDDVIVVDGHSYFPAGSVDMAFLRQSAHESICGWKGTANYYDIVVGDEVNTNAAWYYATPSPAASRVSGRIGFWKGVRVEFAETRDAASPPERFVPTGQVISDQCQR